MKISDKIQKIHAKGEDSDGNKTYYSFEYYPPKTDNALENFYQRVDRMAALNPLWMDITWGAGGSTEGKTLEIAQHIQMFTGIDCMMHLTCTNMKRE